MFLTEHHLRAKITNVPFQHESITVNGVKVAMLTAGSGEPLVFFHGAGVWHGFDFAEPWAEHFRVIIPYHPGWGDSDDAPPHLATVDDYVLHYLEMFDQLGLKQVNLGGISMGGRLAATFAIHHRERVRRLVLMAPAGLDIPEHPLPDFSKIPPEEVPSYLVNDVSAIAMHLPKGPDPAFAAARAREGAGIGRLIQSGLIGPFIAHWAHRITMPTLLIWGENDRVINVAHAAHWMRLLPHAKLLRIPNAGHLPLDDQPSATQAVPEFLLA